MKSSNLKWCFPGARKLGKWKTWCLLPEWIIQWELWISSKSDFDTRELIGFHSCFLSVNSEFCHTDIIWHWCTWEVFDVMKLLLLLWFRLLYSSTRFAHGNTMISSPSLTMYVNMKVKGAATKWDFFHSSSISLWVSSLVDFWF